MKDFEVVPGKHKCITIVTSATMRDLAALFRKLADEIEAEASHGHTHLDQPVYKWDYFYQGLNIRVRCDERLL